MSLNKRLCLRSDSQNSDSFSDRFCDDLSEVILQYLSLEDKLRLQCVSKQFQRTVFQRHYELYINMRGPEDHKYFLKNKDKYLIRKVNNYYYITSTDQSLNAFKALLKQCPNITSIVVFFNYWDRHFSPDQINEVFRLIIENCNNLNEFNILKDINDSNFEEFHRKFGPKIKYLRFFRELIELNLFPNIEKIIINYVPDYSIIPQLNLAKLKQLELTLHEDEENMLQTFIDTFPTLTHLKVYINSEYENTIYKPLDNISNLKHLIHLTFSMNVWKNNNRLFSLLKQMENNCQNLKSIDCRFGINDKNSDIKQSFSQLKAFPLKRLNLRFYLVDNYEDYGTDDEEEDIIDVIDANNLFSFELFKGLSNITHLSLRFDQTLKEPILKEIDIYLPNLQYLEIKDRFFTTTEGVTQMADILSRLSRLQTIKLFLSPGLNCKPIEEQITKKCRKIRKIEIKISNI